MNLQTWAKWVSEINELLGGAEIQLRTGPYSGMTISVRWMDGEKLMGYKHAMSLGEMERMHEAVQPCVLKQIANAVRKMTPNAGGNSAGTALSCQSGEPKANES